MKIKMIIEKVFVYCVCIFMMLVVIRSYHADIVFVIYIYT